MSHRAELHDLEGPSMQTNARLSEQQRTTALQKHGYRYQKRQWSHNHEGDDGNNYIADTFRRQEGLRLSEPFRQDEPTGRKPIQRDSPCDALVHVVGFFDLDAEKFQIQQFLKRHLAPALR